MGAVQKTKNYMKKSLKNIKKMKTTIWKIHKKQQQINKWKQQHKNIRTDLCQGLKHGLNMASMHGKT